MRYEDKKAYDFIHVSQSENKRDKIKETLVSDEHKETTASIIKEIDEAAKDFIYSFDLGNELVYEMTEESLWEITDEYEFQPHRAKYMAKKDGVKYFLLISRIPAGGDKNDEVTYKCLLYKKGKRAYSVFDNKVKQWTRPRYFPKICRLMEESEAVAEFLDDIFKPQGYFPQQINAEILNTLILKNGNMISLRESIGYYVYPSDGYETYWNMLVSKNMNKGRRLENITDLSAILVAEKYTWPCSILRGGMVFYDEHGYHLCQYLSEDDIRGYIEFVFFSSNRTLPEYKRYNGFINIVFSTTDMYRMRDAVRFLWKRDMNKETGFSFPLSETARVDSYGMEGPYKLVVDECRRQSSSLTEQERHNLQIAAWKVREIDKEAQNRLDNKS